MAWKRLDSVIAKVVDRVVNEVGEGVAAATAPDAVNVAKSRKGPEAVAPGQVREEDNPARQSAGQSLRFMRL